MKLICSSLLFIFFIFHFFAYSLAMAFCEQDLLPRQLFFRDSQTSYNQRYFFAIDRGHLCFKSRTNLSDNWSLLKVPQSLKGEIKSISADDKHLVAVGKKNRVYISGNALTRTPAHLSWSKLWGHPFGWNPQGLILPKKTVDWDISFLSPIRDKRYIDSVHNSHGLGYGISTLYALQEGGQHIIYYDPWLPGDNRYRICGPKNGRFKAISLSASGSTVVTMSKHGDLFIRRYDFDMVGADSVFMFYTYTRPYHFHYNKLIELFFCRRRLPIPGWLQLPKVPGEITDRITIEKLGVGARFSKISVEGRKIIPGYPGIGYQTGVFSMIHDFLPALPLPTESLVTSPETSQWTFTSTNEPIQGKWIENYNWSRDTSDEDLGEKEGHEFQGEIGKDKSIKAKLSLFDGYCSPTKLTLHFSDSPTPLHLNLHTHETVHLFKKGDDLDRHPLRLGGALELTKSERSTTDSNEKKKFIKKYFKDDTFIKMKVTLRKKSLHLTRLGIRKNIDWTLYRSLEK